MDLFNKIMKVLWSILEKNKKCSINIATIDNILTINILKGKRKRTFAAKDGQIVLLNLQHYLNH